MGANKAPFSLRKGGKVMTGNFVLAGITVLFAIFFLIFSLQLPPSSTPITLGPGVWPTTILLFMLIMGIILFIRTLLEKGRASNEKKADDILAQSEDIEKEFEAVEVYKSKYMLVIGVLFVSLLAMSYLGFIITAPLMLIAIAIIIGIKRWVPIILASLIGTACLTYIFPIVLSVTLPRGVGIFKSFTEMFY